MDIHCMVSTGIIKDLNYSKLVVISTEVSRTTGSEPLTLKDVFCIEIKVHLATILRHKINSLPKKLAKVGSS